MFSLLLGGVITILVFYISSTPNSPEEIKEELLSISIEKMEDKYNYKNGEHSIDKVYAYELDVGTDKTILLVGSAKVENKFYRWISIFEKSVPSVIDKLVGRSGFYEIASLSSFEAPYFNSLVVDKIEVIDLESNGTSEIHVRLKSTWADSSSAGPLIYTKNTSGDWNVFTLPSISETINSGVKDSNMKGRRPFKYFGMKVDTNPESKPIDELKKLKVSEENWDLNHNGQKIEFTTLRNGGDYFFKTHPIKGYAQVQTLSFFVDGGAVLGPHYAVINMFKFSESGLDVDDLWNWEYPIYSTRPLRLLEIDVGSIGKAGIQAHVVGDIFYGYTEFEKIRPQQ